MRAITLWQPWATLAIEGRKKIETRAWKPGFTGPIAIHAGRTVKKEFVERFGVTSAPLGCVLGVVEVVGTMKFTERNVAESVPKDQLPYGDFFPGRYGWMLRVLMKFETPIPARGSRMIWDWIPPAYLAKDLRRLEIHVPKALKVGRPSQIEMTFAD